jgi:hypothetical protein
MRNKLVLAALATATMLGVGSVSASAAPLGATPLQAQSQQGVLLKAGYRDDHRPWWKKRHNYRYYGYGYGDRPWWWRKKFDRDYRHDRRDHRDDRRDHRRRDW